jgi:RNA polymerase sigma factor for flagellar operon FliA
VKYVVDRLALHLPKSVERDDLVSAAIIGLFDALEKYDKTKGTKFETYAIWRIRGAILDELRSLDWASRSIRRKARVEDAARELARSWARGTEVEVAEALNLSPVELEALDEYGNAPLLQVGLPTRPGRHQLEDMSTIRTTRTPRGDGRGGPRGPARDVDGSRAAAPWSLYYYEEMC